MTHETMIAATWFSKREIVNALETKQPDAYCDKITAGIADGGYGANILEKVSPHASEREFEAERLAHFKLSASKLCPVCGG